MSSASFYFPLKINYLVVYPYAGCHSGQQTALLPLLPMPPASPVPSPVATICRCVCCQLLHTTHSGAWTRSAHDGNGAIPTEALTSDKQQIIPCPLGCSGVATSIEGQVGDGMTLKGKSHTEKQIQLSSGQVNACESSAALCPSLASCQSELAPQMPFKGTLRNTRQGVSLSSHCLIPTQMTRSFWSKQ